jgi:hypothetical protein
MAVRAFARWYGVAHVTVLERIKAGALPTSSAVINGRPKILDALKAAAEWEANTRPWGYGPAPATEPDDLPSPMAVARLREREVRTETMQLEMDRKKGLLVPAREVELRWSAHVVAARTAMLAIPSRYKQRVPHATTADLDILDKLIREALEELADGAAL